MQDLPNKTLFTVKEVAKFLNIHTSTVYRYIKLNMLAYTKIRSQIRIYRNSIIKLINYKDL